MSRWKLSCVTENLMNLSMWTCDRFANSSYGVGHVVRVSYACSASFTLLILVLPIGTN